MSPSFHDGRTPVKQCLKMARCLFKKLRKLAKLRLKVHLQKKQARSIHINQNIHTHQSRLERGQAGGTDWLFHNRALLRERTTDTDIRDI